nr:carboxypeptidase M32 [Olegusella massiliensis]
MSNKLPSFMKQSHDEQKNAQHTDEEKLQQTAEVMSASQQSLDLDEPDSMAITTEEKPHREVPAGSLPTLPGIPGIPPLAADAAVPNPRADLEALDKLERHLYAHRYATVGMSCYGMSIDPEDATADRGEALAILQEEAQELLCSPATGALLDRLSTATALELENDTQRAQVRILKRDRVQLVDVPADEQAAFTRLVTESDDVWHKAKAANDWGSFAPYLDRITESMRRLANYKKPGVNAYDVWLDEFEQGSSTAFYDRFFEQVKELVVPLLAEVSAARRKPSHRLVEGHFDERRQWEVATDVARIEGLSFQSLFLTKTEHPFSDALTTNYAVIAAHVYEDDVFSNVFTMLHEGGHALYEQGVNPEYNYTSLKGGTSSGMHEAQSRFFENYVGRSEAFSGPLLEILRRHFPGHFNRVSARQLYLAANVVMPQPIRVEADELTYPLHILVRYELEQLLMSGEAKAADIPDLWAQKYREYLGVRVPDATHGALQDTHWADGLIGYFPTYALGGAYGAQFRAAMISEGMDWEGVIASGNLAPIREWLRSHIWHYGRSRDPKDIILAATGEPFVTRHYTDYLTQKFSSIYGL